MEAIARWWDSVELWVISLPFIPQVLLVLVVVLPLCFAGAAGLDRVVGRVLDAVAALLAGPSSKGGGDR